MESKKKLNKKCTKSRGQKMCLENIFYLIKTLYYYLLLFGKHYIHVRDIKLLSVLLQYS